MIVSDFYLRNRTETKDSSKLLANELNVLNCTRRWIVCVSEDSELKATDVSVLFNFPKTVNLMDSFKYSNAMIASGFYT